jgi:hypothetical protein
MLGKEFGYSGNIGLFAGLPLLEAISLPKV